MSIIVQAAAWIGEPLGGLVYHLVLLFVLQATVVLALSRWRRRRSTAEARLAFAAVTLLLLRLAALVTALLTAVSLWDPLIALPPLDRALSTLTLLLIIWAFALPEPQPLADAITGGLALLIVLALGMSWRLWVQDVAAGAPFYNGSAQETAWEVAKIALLLGGLVLLGARRRSGWPIGLALLTLLLVGHLTHYFFPLGGSDFAGAERLAEVVAFPLLTILIYRRFPLPAAGAQPIGSTLLFPNYTQMPSRVPQWVWRGLRLLSVGTSLGLCAMLFIRPQIGLFLFWGFIIPLLPLVFFITPGLWRNVCPLAAVNQTPRLFGFTRDRTLPNWLKKYDYVIALSRLGILALTVVWVARTYAKEPLFIAQTIAGQVRVGSSQSLVRHRDSRLGYPEVTFTPEGLRVVVEPGRTLLEIAESNGLHIEAGCRMGMCGSDAVAILRGMENLSPIGNDEQTTLTRLGLAENTRMACCARVHGLVSVSLKPERREAPLSKTILDFRYDPSIARVVIIGNGIVGVTAADHVRRRHPQCEIHLVGREKYHLYNRMAISRLIYGRSAMQGLYLLPEAWYDERQITCWLNTRVVRIDCEAREVILGTGEKLPYDRLILAMGSNSFVPPIEGFGLAGTFVLREADDAMQMRAFAQEEGCRHAAVVGGGLLGVEAGYALHKLGLEVSILDRSEWLLHRHLDARGGQLLHEYLDGLGMEVVLPAEVALVQGSHRVKQVLLKDGRSLPCDLLLVCAGIAPNVALAREAGLAVNRGVVVDDHMRTSAPEILAAGDVAEHRGQIYGLWPTAVAQAEIAALNAVGGDAVYEGIAPVTILKGIGIDLMSLGRFGPESQDEIVIALEELQEHRYRKLVISHGKIVGAILLGYPLEAPAVVDAVKQQADVRPCLDALRAGDWISLSQLVLHR